MSKILVTGSEGRFGKIIKKLNPNKFIFRNKKELNILSNKSIRSNINRYEKNFRCAKCFDWKK